MQEGMEEMSLGRSGDVTGQGLATRCAVPSAERGYIYLLGGGGLRNDYMFSRGNSYR